MAKEAKVAPSTVSYVLNNSKPVTEETKQKIYAAIKKLNYRPNAIARSLKTKTTSTIGLIIPDVSNPFFAEVTRGIEDVANQYGYTVIFCNTDENREKEEKYLKTLLSKGIDGLIFVGTGFYNGDLFNDIDIPVVIVDRNLNKPIKQSGYVVTDNERGAYEATVHLIEKGCREILLLSGPLTINTYRERLKGYKKGIESHNIEFNEELVFQCSVSIENGYKMMQDIINYDCVIKGIFASNDFIAIGAMKALEHNGYSIPTDVKVIGFDDIYISKLITPALTTVAQPKYGMGVEAMKMLYGLMKEERIRQPHLTMIPSLVIRESC